MAARARVNGLALYYEIVGEGDPLVLVHGSWVDHETWQRVVPLLARSFRVLVYDRRGHSRSERPPGQGGRRQDEDDLASLIELLGAPAHVAANSFGASTALGLATRRPELLRTLTAHEPPLMGIVDDGDRELRPVLQAMEAALDGVLAALRAGEDREGARRFVDEVVIGPGAWERLPERERALLTANASTFADEHGDPDWARLDLARLSAFPGPALLTFGSESPPWFPVIVGKLATALDGRARIRTLPGDGHVPHLTHPDRYAADLTAFIRSIGVRPVAGG
ncbi:pimeloyl-ACP methyl ester carboxylesterase [Streptomyces sp. 2132.2]|uniref:alpha/beta fold hydrolase n=1 Tax=Streptomyces sp. 2132.2 TaxID=2485161 RepID=UPI000F48FB31|nr:alpha/beta hydrolase [Streptomyces sp. 2132.2]ROQ96128.1 pimeloyl-ACP methyl ester carboxylesterase [Streptomyces sp. 2132.2]